MRGKDPRGIVVHVDQAFAVDRQITALVRNALAAGRNTKFHRHPTLATLLIPGGHPRNAVALG